MLATPLASHTLPCRQLHWFVGTIATLATQSIIIHYYLCYDDNMEKLKSVLNEVESGGLRGQRKQCKDNDRNCKD